MIHIAPDPNAGPLPTDKSSAIAWTDNDKLIGDIGAALVGRGWWTRSDVVEPTLIEALQNELDLLRQSDQLRRAGIGRDLDFQLDREIRSDLIVWLNRSRPAQAAFLTIMDRLRTTLNRELFLGLFEFEGHFAYYPPGGFYKRHRDSFRGAANRVVSVVTYLNADWQPGDGGELVLFAEDEATEIASIEPRAGTLVVFLSEEIPHEVRPANRDRTSIAGWFRLNSSVNNQIDPPR